MMRSGGWTPFRKFLLGGCSLFVVFSLIGAVLEARYLKATTLALAEREGTALGRYLGSHYFRPGEFLNSKGDLEFPATLVDPLRDELAELGIVMLKVYDLSGTIVASTDPAFVGMKRGDNPSFRKAIAGKTVSKVADREYYRDLYGRETSEDVFELYVPLWTQGRNAPEAVLEIYRPWSLYQPLVRAGMVRTAVVAVVLTGTYFLLLALFVRRVGASEPARPAPRD